MAPDHASRNRVAALTASPTPSASSPSVGPTGPTEPVDATPRSGPAEQPDPEFWGAEPRRVRATRRSGPDPRAVPEWWAAVLDRVRDGRLELGVGAVVVAALALGAGVVWYRMGVDGGAPPPAGSVRPAVTTTPTSGGRRASAAVDRGTPAVLPAGATPVTVTTAAAAAAHRGPTVVVHVAGAVIRPGVLLMPEGARVIDAVEGAGGATPDADLDRLNLAARLVDGQRILVAKVGATAVAGPGGVTDPAADPGALIELNAATTAQLETLPGIGPALAGAIIAERDRRGGFRSINELREVRGIGEARFADLRERVTV